MAASARDVSLYQQLNGVLKSLGERGNEAQVYKEYNDHVASYMLEQLSEFWGKNTENHIMVRPYGSAAEDLKCLAPDDYGDVDIMIFPNADNCLIYDDLLEYSSENPLHLKIKASDHPVLQSCLVEDTEYVAASAVKNFHPAIYGSASAEFIDSVRHVLQVMSREDVQVLPECIFDWKNKDKGNSPAFTLDINQSLETMSEELQKIKNAQSWHNMNPAEWEWMARLFCTLRGTEYTKEHAEVLNDYFQYAREVVQASVTEDGSSRILQGFPGVLQELCYSDAVKNFQARVQAIESQSQNESGSRKSEVVCHGPDESGSDVEPPSVETLVTPQNCDDAHRSTEDLKCTPGFDSAANAQQFSEEGMATQVTKSDGEDDQTDDTKNRDHDKGHNEAETDFKKATVDGKEDDIKKELDRKMRNKRLFEHMLGTKTEMTGHTDKDKEYKRKLGIDLVPALRCRGWPKVAREWIKRDRKWPSPETVEKVLQEGFHLVVKPPKRNGNPDCDLRISFSHAEYLLSQEMNDIQRECYRCLKKYYRAYLSKSTGFVTFHLKNLLLQTIEETGAEMWTESNRAECMMKLLGNLLEALTKKHLRYFFVGAYNLLGIDYIEDPKSLEYLAKEVEKIIESPMEFSNKLIQNQHDHENDAKQVKKEEWFPSSETVSEHGLEGTEKTRSGGQSDTQRKEEALTFPLLQTETTQRSSPIPNYRYHDLKDIYLQVCKEMIDMALNDADQHNLETLDPLEKSLVEDLRELASIHGLRVENCLKMFGAGWDMAYNKAWMSTEPDMRRRMLDAIQGQLEMWKYMLKQEDLAPGNEEAIANRMLDPSADDPFDLSHVFLAGGAVQILRRWINSLTLQPAQPQVVNMDDIPLD